MRPGLVDLAHDGIPFGIVGEGGLGNAWNGGGVRSWYFCGGGAWDGVPGARRGTVGARMSLEESRHLVEPGELV